MRNFQTSADIWADVTDKEGGGRLTRVAQVANATDPDGNQSPGGRRRKVTGKLAPSVAPETDRSYSSSNRSYSNRRSYCNNRSYSNNIYNSNNRSFSNNIR